MEKYSIFFFASKRGDPYNPCCIRVEKIVFVIHIFGIGFATNRLKWN